MARRQKNVANFKTVRNSSAMRKLFYIALLMMLPGHSLAEGLKPGATMAFFGITFIDTSTEGAYNGERPDEMTRVKMVETYVAEELQKRGFTLVDISPVEEGVNRIVNVADCNFCDVLMARELGVDYSVVGEVQKVSNLILSMNLIVRDTVEGKHAKGMSVDIRGNNDNSWKRGMRYILKNNVFKE